MIKKTVIQNQSRLATVSVGNTLSNLREKVAFSPFFLVASALSNGIKRALKAPGSESNRDLNNSRVRI